MTRRRDWIAGITLAAGLAMPPAAQGAAQRTFVASTGADTNPCSIAAPCRSFGQAASQTTANGEIVVLDSAGYGPVTITQSLSIVAPPGVYAGVSVFAGNGIVINGASIRVVLRGLTVNGQGGSYGIVVNDSLSVHIENVVVSGMANSGILVNGGSGLFIKDTQLRNNGARGLDIVPLFGSQSRVAVDRLRSEGNGSDGIYVDNDVYLNVRDSVVARNGGAGINVFPDSGETVSVGVEGTALVNNQGFGVVVQGGGAGVVVVGGNVIKDNFDGGLARIATGITVLSRQNNTIAVNNGTEVTGAVTPLSGL
jgi:hypothetical protein